MSFRMSLYGNLSVQTCIMPVAIILTEILIITAPKSLYEEKYGSVLV